MKANDEILSDFYGLMFATAPRVCCVLSWMVCGDMIDDKCRVWKLHKSEEGGK